MPASSPAAEHGRPQYSIVSGKANGLETAGSTPHIQSELQTALYQQGCFPSTSNFQIVLQWGARVDKFVPNIQFEASSEEISPLRPRPFLLQMTQIDRQRAMT
jgi:hypothetical protein